MNFEFFYTQKAFSSTLSFIDNLKEWMNSYKGGIFINIKEVN